MIKLMDMINESEKPKYEFGCVMLYFDFPEMESMHDKINKDDIYTSEGGFGLEDEPHTTLLFGLHKEVTDEQIKDVLGRHKFGECQLHNASLFENSQYDVLKFDVKGKGLHECNSDLTKHPHTTNFPDYHPHLTIGYLKPGTGKKHTDLFNGLEYTLKPRYAMYSKPDGTKSKLEIGVSE